MSSAYPRKPQAADSGMELQILTQSLNTNLHLLNLDLDRRAVQITPITFSIKDKAQNQGQRIRTAEWLLYRLFEVWDRKETQKRLLPFYPEIIQRQSQRQSLDLRAAVFKWLVELKEAALVPKDTTIRKSMLDDCKGDRFVKLVWELSCLALNQTVARDGRDTSAAKQVLLGTARADHLKRATLEAAYQISLKRGLEEKAASTKRYKSFGETLKVKREEMNKRVRELNRKAEAWNQKPLSEGLVSRFETHFKADWEGDPEWADILLHGDHHGQTNGLLERPFEQVWPRVERSTVGNIQSQETHSLLQSLEVKLAEQKARLETWKRIQDDLVIQSATPSNSPFKTPSKTPTRSSAKKPVRTPSNPSRAISARSNVTPLHRRALSVEKSFGAHEPVVDSLPTTGTERTRAANLPKLGPLQRASSLRQPLKSEVTSLIPTTRVAKQNNGPNMGRLSSLRPPSSVAQSSSSNSKSHGESSLEVSRPQPRPSYQQHGRSESTPALKNPNVGSLLAELNTPRRLSSLRQPTRAKARSSLVPQQELGPTLTKQAPAITDTVRAVSPPILLKNPNLHEEDDDLEPSKMELPSRVSTLQNVNMKVMLPKSQEPPIHHSRAQVKPSKHLPSSTPLALSHDVVCHDMVPKPAQLSLAERTRVSMANLSPTKEKTDPMDIPTLTSHSVIPSQRQCSSHAFREQHISTSTLAERTRRSMARLSPTKEKSDPLTELQVTLQAADPCFSASSRPTDERHSALQARTRLSMLESAAKAPQRRASLRKAVRASRQYPVNQWDDEEPLGAARRKLDSVLETAESKKFEDLDYESAFASRPKLGSGSLVSHAGNATMSLGEDRNLLNEESAFMSKPKEGVGPGLGVETGSEGADPSF